VKLLAAIGVILLALASPAVAREEIRSFVSSTVLSANGTVDVTETITVNAEGDQIRHGIYRDIPTALINPDNSRLRSDLKVIAVTRDNRPEPYSVDGLGTGFKRIKIGSAGTLLEYGEHTYVIHYTMTRMARSLADHDEFYWNATGNYWDFPIMQAVANVTLPTGAKVTGTIGFTGRPGSHEQAVAIADNANGGTTFRSTRELAPGEGMTVDVAFAKGILVTPQGIDAASYWLSDHRELVFPSIAVLILLLYNILAWSAVGRDPRKGTIIPLFHPPKDLSPAMVHYVADMGFKHSGWTAFTATIFDLGVRGLVKIDKAGGDTSITAAGPRVDNLPLGEQSVYDYLHAKGQVTIDKTDGPRLNEKRGELVKEITDKNREVYFRNNVPYTLGGVALAAILLGVLVWLDVVEPVVLIISLVVAIVIGIFVGVASSGGGGRGVFSSIFGFIWFGVIAVNIFGSVISVNTDIHFDMGLVGAVSIVLIEIVFAVLMRAPTVQGRSLMDEIDGFKMYLETAEKNRLNYVDKGEPAMTVPRFEAILPFAIALGVEKLWSQRFEGDLARNAVQGVQGGSYSPLWYTGGNWSDASSGIASSVSSMSSAMTSAMISAQPSSSGGSGFGGGGGSGGGGGGGGGGGW
jgi:Predicted membrane protein (DUF2207)